MEDERLSFLGDSIASICQLDDKRTVIAALKSSKDTRNFLDDLRLISLKAIVFKDGHIELTSDFSSSIKYEDAYEEVMFVKRNTESLNPENISKILEVQSLQGSPLDGLYSSLKGVWCPMLLQNKQWTEKLPPKVQQLLTELESTLSSSIRVESKTSGSSSTVPDFNDISGITTLADEQAFWNRMREVRKLKEFVRPIEHALNEIAPNFANLTNQEFTAVSDVVAKSFDSLNAMWSSPGPDNKSYPQSRMVHVFDMISSTICAYIQNKCSSIDIWKDPSGTVRIQLQAAIRLLEQWLDVTKKLTGTFWASGSEHQWSGDVSYDDTVAKAYLQRVEHVLKIRTLSDELAQLLTAEERRSFHLERLFEPLEDTRPLAYNPYTEPMWKRAVAKYEESVAPVEIAVASHFRQKISPIMDRPLLLLREFQQYRHLLQRPNIRKSLVGEREALLALLKDLCKKIETSVDHVEGGGNGDSDSEGTGGFGGGRLSSPRIAGIVLLRQLGARVASMLNTSQGLLDDLDAFPRFAAQCESLISRIKNEEVARFESWVGDIETRIEDEDDGLKLQGSLVKWEDGVLVVNFSESLVCFLREVRQLDELGFEIPRTAIGRNKSIADKALEAERFYRYGILLKKTANFYNSISEQMIDVQEQLLLASLKAFMNIVSKPSGGRAGGEVSWNNPTDCENYIRALQECAEQLSSENRFLRKVHEDLRVLTIALMNLDLLRQTDTWRDKWRTLKEKMSTVTSRYPERDCTTWVLHWDHQVFKAMEASYQLGLESLHENLPEIKVEMVFANKRLEFKPPLEQIRQNFYKEMRKFIAMPGSFEGFKNPALYKKMGAKNSNRLIKVFSKAEALFDRLTNLLKKYSSWVRLGQVDLDHYIETQVISVEEFVANFKMLKVKRKEIDKIADMEKVGCCTVSLMPFKSFLETLLLRVSDVLLVQLRRGILQDFKEVDVFLETSLEKLNARPQSVEEISSAKKQWSEIDSMKNSIKLSYRSCADRKKLLLEYAPGTAVDTSEVTQRMSNLDGEGGRWDEFDIALEAFNDMVEEQKEVLKSTIENDIIALNQDIIKFKSRWNQLKPSEVKSWDESVVQKVFDALQDWSREFEVLDQKAKVLIESCSSFGLVTPRFDGMEALADDIKYTSQSWDLLKSWEPSLLRTGCDFATRWLETLKTTYRGKFDDVGEHIAGIAEKIKKSVPALKYCRGEPFKEDHWIELLQGRLQLPRDVRKENIRVEHFLSCLDILMEPGTLSFVKNLQARALGEVQIREALQELKTWQRTAELKLLTTEESGRKIPLIKDWKDMFLEMGDKQSLLASLKESQFYKAFADEGTSLEAKLAILDAALHTLNSIQPIFSRGALPSEEARFRRIDEDFTEVMNSIAAEPLLFNLADER
eukprot:gene6819-13816_t